MTHKFIQEDISEIEPYFFEKSAINGFDFYNYLHIHGGAGHGKSGSGGRYRFVLFYARPEQTEGMNMSAEVWCEEKGIVYGVGDTIQEAYNNYSIKYLNHDR